MLSLRGAPSTSRRSAQDRLRRRSNLIFRPRLLRGVYLEPGEGLAMTRTLSFSPVGCPRDWHGALAGESDKSSVSIEAMDKFSVGKRQEQCEDDAKMECQ